jgi:RNA polymerase sigma factor (sigma-70 family)
MSRHYTPSTHTSREFESNLSEFRLAAGMTIDEVCTKANITKTEYVCLNSGVKAPIYIRNGEIKPSAERLSKILNADLFDLWPRYFCSLPQDKLQRDEVIWHFHRGLLSSEYVESPEKLMEMKEDHDIAHLIFDKLTMNERQVLWDRYNGYTLDEIGKDLSMSREYVRIIEKKALANIVKIFNDKSYTVGYINKHKVKEQCKIYNDEHIRDSIIRYAIKFHRKNNISFKDMTKVMNMSLYAIKKLLRKTPNNVYFCKNPKYTDIIDIPENNHVQTLIHKLRVNWYFEIPYEDGDIKHTQSAANYLDIDVDITKMEVSPGVYILRCQRVPKSHKGCSQYINIK